MDEWDLDPPPRQKTRLPEAGPENTPVSAPGPGVAPDRGATGLAPANGPANGPAAAAPGVGTAMDGAGGSDRKMAPSGLRRRKVITVLPWFAAGVVLLVVGALIGFTIARSQADHNAAELAEVRNELGVMERALSQAEERNWSYYRENLALKAEIEAGQSDGSTSTSTTTPQSGTRTTYGDGLYLVGEDIAVGDYDGIVVGKQGYWARLKGTDGLVSSIIANAIPREPFVLTIIVSDRAVELRGVEITAR